MPRSLPTTSRKHDNATTENTEDESENAAERFAAEGESCCRRGARRRQHRRQQRELSSLKPLARRRFERGAPRGRPFFWRRAANFAEQCIVAGGTRSPEVSNQQARVPKSDIIPVGALDILSLVRCHRPRSGDYPAHRLAAPSARQSPFSGGSLKAARDGRAAFFVARSPRTPQPWIRSPPRRAPLEGPRMLGPQRAFQCRFRRLGSAPNVPSRLFPLVDEPRHDVAIAARHLHLRP